MPATALLAGLFIGSFLNVVIYRGPALWGLIDEAGRGDLIRPRSKCPNCGAAIRRRHLAPLAGYLALGGKCAACRAPISLRYPMVELLGGLAALAAYAAFGPAPEALAAALFFFFLIALGGVDFETGYLPDALTLPLVGLGLVFNAVFGHVGLLSAAVGAGAGYLAFLAFAALYKAVRAREGLGRGDAKLLAAIGAWTGWHALPAAVFVAAAATLAVVLLIRLSGRAFDDSQPLPFGPGLCAGGAAVFLAQAAGLL